MLHIKQASDLLQDLIPTLTSMSSAKLGNKYCSRSEACFVCSMNYCNSCDHDSSKSHVGSQCW